MNLLICNILYKMIKCIYTQKIVSVFNFTDFLKLRIFPASCLQTEYKHYLYACFRYICKLYQDIHCKYFKFSCTFPLLVSSSVAKKMCSHENSNIQQTSCAAVYGCGFMWMVVRHLIVFCVGCMVLFIISIEFLYSCSSII